jgi:sec-independent protein translocase protein TatB
MFNVGAGELLAILALALIVLGPGRLPDAVRTAGRAMGELRRISGDLQRELRTALDVPDPDPDDPDPDPDDVLEEEAVSSPAPPAPRP